ncbi:nSTAND1 domain-containing NTPase [Mycolicibacterium fluoranthenivorans]|uniref:nSTAND1 domain-containing NTPase n=1 Tax=Mycolicibacterium fluoranthenivorans TaxID=258505 RepID=UPI001F1D8D56|nr:AAA family ATPase [Mycolicibacterium fluoranthenivorans]
MRSGKVREVVVEDELERHFLQKINCPWPGPRPLSVDSPAWSLIGRTESVGHLLALIRRADILVITGSSGVGKTSLLRAGLMPALRRVGFRVVTVQPRHATADGGSAMKMVIDSIGRELSLPLSGGLDENIEQIDELFPDRVVVYLDQFEELIRHSRRSASQLLRSIETLASHTSIRFVVSIRSEFEHQLSGRMGLRQGAFRRERYEVPELVEREHFSAIVASANQVAPKAVDAEVCRIVVNLWSKALSDDKDVGLLDFQALLFCLWNSRSGDSVDMQALKTLEAEATERYGPTSLLEVSIPEAVRLSVKVALDVAQDLHRSKRLNSLHAVNAVMCIRELSKYLGSGSYKIAVERRELAAKALTGIAHQVSEDKISLEDPSIRRLEQMADTPGAEDVLGWLSLPRRTYGLDDYTSGLWPWKEDTENRTSGPLLGKRWEAALFEYYRSFILGIKLLSAAGIVRTNNMSGGKQSVTLIHDRFAIGLQNWREGLAQDFADIAARPIATEGGFFEVDNRNDKPRVIANLRWLHGTISGNLSATVFVNCDFTGTRFSCRFDGVTFVNCMLDDVIFETCEIIGGEAPSLPGRRSVSEQKLGDLPTFRVKADGSYVESLGWYEGRTDKADCLLSLTGGMPAVTASMEKCDSAPLIQPPAHGINIFGGRISGFKMRNCVFDSDGWFQLNGVAGTSIEFADQSGLHLLIIGSALRGLAVTAPLDQTENSQTKPAIKVVADDSILIDLWLGRGLVGHFKALRCRMWQLLNASEQLKVHLWRSPYHSLINVATIEKSDEEGFQVHGLGDVEALVRQVSETIDFRAHPVDKELTDILDWWMRSGSLSGQRQPS